MRKAMRRIGIIGTGIIAHEHLKAAREIPGLEVSAVSNRTIEKALRFAGQYGIPSGSVYDDYRAMLRNESLDAVICLANHIHAECFLECAKAGVAVLLEKPMAQDSRGCELINDAVSRYGIKLMMGHTQRYNENYRAAKRVIDEGSLGRLITMTDAIYYNYFWEGRPQWFLNPGECGGGILVNYGVHTFDRIQFLSGCRVERVFAHVDWEMPGIKVDSSYQIAVLMENGVSACMTCTGYSGPFCNFTEMVFTGGVLRVRLKGNALEREGVWIGTNEHDFEAVPVEKGNPYLNQLRDFIRYLDGEIPSPIDGIYGEAMVRQVEASYASHASGQAVEVRYRF